MVSIAELTQLDLSQLLMGHVPDHLMRETASPVRQHTGSSPVFGQMAATSQPPAESLSNKKRKLDALDPEKMPPPARPAKRQAQINPGLVDPRQISSEQNKSTAASTNSNSVSELVRDDTLRGPRINLRKVWEANTRGNPFAVFNNPAEAKTIERLKKAATAGGGVESLL